MGTFTYDPYLASMSSHKITVFAYFRRFLAFRGVVTLPGPGFGIPRGLERSTGALEGFPLSILILVRILIDFNKRRK